MNSSNHDRKLTVLSASDVRRALPMGEAIEAMREAFAQLARGAVVMPPRTHLDMPGRDGVALFMPSCLPEAGRFGIKVVNLFGGNPALGLPRIQALVTVFDGATGSPLAILDGTVLTAIRTGAASGLATDLLARPEARNVAVFGAGVQARTQLEAVCAVRAVERARVFDPSEEAAEAFARRMGRELKIDLAAERCPKAALAGADVVCCATTSPEPVFADADLPVGVHVNAIGSYQPHVQEIPAETVARALVVVDHLPSALEETGDLIIPIREGRYAPERIHGELGEVVLGRRPGRDDPGQTTLFKSVGVAIQDLAAAGRAMERAARLGLGQQVCL